MTETIYLVDEFVNVRVGEPFRLFPFGSITRMGKRREITPELARQFKLPHYHPPIKLGSHQENTPAGGHIVALEVRDDGLYGVPEYNDEGAQALTKGSYRYHSPEILWQGALEDAITGEMIPGPLILGDALLHSPALGEAAALYTVEVKEITMSENVQVPAPLFERFTAWLDSRTQPEEPEQKAPKEPTPITEADEYKVIVQQRDNLQAKIDELEAEKNHAARVEHFAAELKGAKIEIDEWAERLTGLPEDAAGSIVQAFKALSAQIEANDELTKATGTEKHNTEQNPVQAFDAAVQAKAKEAKVDYTAALQMVAADNPDLFAAYEAARQ